MSEKEFDIIIKHKLADSEFVPTNAGWENLHKSIITNNYANNTINTSNKSKYKFAWAAAILLPIGAIATYLLLNIPGNKLVQNTNTTFSKTSNTSSTDSILEYKTSINNASANNITNNVIVENKNNYTTNNKTNVSIDNNNTLYNNNQYNINTVVNKNANNYKSILPEQNTVKNNQPELVNNNIVYNKVNNILNDNKKIIADVLDNKNNNIVHNKNTNNTNYYANNNATNNNYYRPSNPLGISVIMGYGSSKGNAAIKQAGILIQQKINQKLFADASIQISNQGGGVINNGSALKANTYSQDINILSGNPTSSISSEINSTQSRAVNRVPIKQIICNPTLGYNLSSKSFVTLGVEIAKNIKDNTANKLNNDLDATSPVVKQSTSKLGDWDGGLTTKFGYKLSRRLVAEAKYRQGLINVIDNLSGNTKRSYGVVALQYRLK